MFDIQIKGLDKIQKEIDRIIQDTSRLTEKELKKKC